MPIIPKDERQSANAELVARGVSRCLRTLGFACVTEFSLPTGRRADVAAIGRDGEIWIIEIKSSVQDFRSDLKWREYRNYCDRFFFAIPQTLDAKIIPVKEGLFIADGYGAQMVRDSEMIKLTGARRRSLMLAFAHCAANRLTAAIDPDFHPGA